MSVVREMYRAEPRTNDHSPLCRNDEFISRLLYAMHCAHTAMQFIAIEITIMHKIQIE